MSKSKIDKFEMVNNSVVTLASKVGHRTPVIVSEDENYSLKIELSNLTKSQYVKILDKIETIVEEK